MSQNRKAAYSEPAQSNKKNATDSSQDWVCIKCNNLNFSFRKKCNRCKVQSREDNQQVVYLDYYYYNHYYHYQTQDYQKKPSQEFTSEKQLYASPISPIKKSFQSETNIQDKENRTLPSVSPLVKKYKDSQSKKRKQTSKNFWKGEPIQTLFGQQIWNAEEFQQVDLRHVEKELSATDDEQANEEFIRSVQKMIV